LDFLTVAQPNEGVYLKTGCFEQLATYAIDFYHFRGNLFFYQFSHFLNGVIFLTKNDKN